MLGGNASPLFSQEIFKRSHKSIISLRSPGCKTSVTEFFLWPWDFPGKNTGVASHFLLQGNLPTPGDLPDPGMETGVSCIGRWILLSLAPPGEPNRPVQFSSVAQSCPTFCDPMGCRTPGFPVHHQLPEFTQTRVHYSFEILETAAFPHCRDEKIGSREGETFSRGNTVKIRAQVHLSTFFLSRPLPYSPSLSPAAPNSPS